MFTSLIKCEIAHSKWKNQDALRSGGRRSAFFDVINSGMRTKTTEGKSKRGCMFIAKEPGRDKRKKWLDYKCEAKKKKKPISLLKKSLRATCRGSTNPALSAVDQSTCI